MSESVMDRLKGVGRALRVVSAFFARIDRAFDASILWFKARWALFALAVFIYVLRVTAIRGFFIVTYGLGIYLLNLLIGFLTPAVDPEVLEFEAMNSNEMELPVSISDEFRPFTRKLPEYQFWYCGVRATAVSIAMTFVPAFDLPVFWPILLVYFVFIFCLTMKQQILHMIRYRYVPWSLGKKSYARGNDGGARGAGHNRSN